MGPFNSNLDQVSNILDTLVNFDPEKKGIYYDEKKGSLKSFESKWFITYFKKRSEKISTREALQKIDKLFEKSVTDLQKDLANPNISQKQKEEIREKAETVHRKIQDLKMNRDLQKSIREKGNTTLAKRVDKLLNLLNKNLSRISEVLESDKKALNKFEKTLSSLAHLKNSPAQNVSYDETDGRFFVTDKQVSKDHLKKQIGVAMQKLHSDLKNIQEHLHSLSPFENLNIKDDRAPNLILKEIKKAPENLKLKKDLTKENLNNIIKYKGLIEKMHTQFADAAIGFNHLLSQLSPEDRKIYQEQLAQLSASVINSHISWVEILTTFEEVLENKNLPQPAPQARAANAAPPPPQEPAAHAAHPPLPRPQDPAANAPLPPRPLPPQDPAPQAPAANAPPQPPPPPPHQAPAPQAPAANAPPPPPPPPPPQAPVPQAPAANAPPSDPSDRHLSQIVAAAARNERRRTSRTNKANPQEASSSPERPSDGLTSILENALIGIRRNVEGTDQLSQSDISEWNDLQDSNPDSEVNNSDQS